MTARDLLLFTGPVSGLIIGLFFYWLYRPRPTGIEPPSPEDARRPTP